MHMGEIMLKQCMRMHPLSESLAEAWLHISDSRLTPGTYLDPPLRLQVRGRLVELITAAV